MTPRGFPAAEFQARTRRAQGLMQAAGLAALFVTTEADLRYFSGFLTRFWESPTRPWFLVLPASGDPIAVIPAIGAELMGKTWVRDIHTWRAPDYADDGVSLLADTLAEVAGKTGRIGTPMGLESHLRMPLAGFAALQARLGAGRIVSDEGIVARLRAVKSEAEIAKIGTACAIAGRAFVRVGEFAAEGVPLDQIFRRFQISCLDEGADWVPYLAGGAGPDGYGDVISPATEVPLARGDILMLDTGLVHDGYFCDYDRNFAMGAPSDAARRGYDRLIEAVAAALPLARPGNTAADLFHAMDRIVTGGAGGSEAGRLGHGLGMQLTEGMSLIPADHTVLEAGMVLTLEPGIEIAPGRILVHEENIVVRESGAEMLSPAAPVELPVLARDTV
ncbi:MAG: aminopeptidase P family protein [Rhodobacteraceae bacterium]|nr:aminopeptidase P family protein [Paracoccaceae bacterium]